MTGWLKYVEDGSPPWGTLERGVPSPPRHPAKSPMTFSSHLLSFGVGALYEAAPFCFAPSALPSEPRADGGAGDARPTEGASSGARRDWYVVVPGVWRLSGGEGVTIAGRMNGCEAGGEAIVLSLSLSVSVLFIVLGKCQRTEEKEQRWRGIAIKADLGPGSRHGICSRVRDWNDLDLEFLLSVVEGIGRCSERQRQRQTARPTSLHSNITSIA